MTNAFNILTTYFAKEEYGSNDPSSISRDTELKSLSIDSLDMSCLICDLEEEYKIIVKDSDLSQKKLITVGDVTDLLDVCMSR